MLGWADPEDTTLEFDRYPASPADGAMAAVDPLTGRLHRGHPPVGHLGVQRARRQTIGLDVRPADTMALNLRGLQPGRQRPDAQLETAHATRYASACSIRSRKAGSRRWPTRQAPPPNQDAARGSSGSRRLGICHDRQQTTLKASAHRGGGSISLQSAVEPGRAEDRWQSVRPPCFRHR